MVKCINFCANSQTIAFEEYCPSFYEVRIINHVQGYGVDEYKVTGDDGRQCVLRLSPTGISSQRSQEKTVHHAWDDILDISFKGKKFILRVKTLTGESNIEHKFYLSTTTQCKTLWKKTIEQHR